MVVLSPKKFSQTKPVEILKKVATVRERKGKGESELKLVDSLVDKAFDYFVNLLFEKALFLQHTVIEEMSKPERERDEKVVKLYIKRMGDVVSLASKLIYLLKAKRLYSRVHRFEGRVFDYAENYSEAVKAYKKALKYYTLDPEFIETGIPRNLEYKAFLAYSTIMAGKVKEGLKMSRQIWNEFISGKTGLRLKKISYGTWAIWATGIPIRVGLASQKVKGIDRKEVLRWLEEAEKLIEKPVKKDKFLGDVDFAIRKGEIQSLKTAIRQVD